MYSHHRTNICYYRIIPSGKNQRFNTENRPFTEQLTAPTRENVAIQIAHARSRGHVMRQIFIAVSGSDNAS